MPDFADLPTFDIRYVDSRGRVTDRRVHPFRFTGGAMYARCMLRNDSRMFLVASIEQVTCPVTGQVFDTLDAYLRDSLGEPDLSEVLEQIAGARELLPHQVRPGRPRCDAGPDDDDIDDWLCNALAVLFWVAASDGEIPGEEALVIEDFVFAVLDRYRDRPSDAEVVLMWRAAMTDIEYDGDLPDFLAPLTEADQTFRDAFWRALERLINADGVQSQEEFAAVQRIRDIWEDLT
jgi:hypothetical protein